MHTTQQLTTRHAPISALDNNVSNTLYLSVPRFCNFYCNKDLSTTSLCYSYSFLQFPQNPYFQVFSLFICKRYAM